jgi:hypothetical protein
MTLVKMFLKGFRGPVAEPLKKFLKPSTEPLGHDPYSLTPFVDSISPETREVLNRFHPSTRERLDDFGYPLTRMVVSNLKLLQEKMVEALPHMPQLGLNPEDGSLSEIRTTGTKAKRAAEYLASYFMTLTDDMIWEVFNSGDFKIIEKISPMDFQFFLFGSMMCPDFHSLVAKTPIYSSAKKAKDFEADYRNLVTGTQITLIPFESVLGYVEKLFGRDLEKAKLPSAILREAQDETKIEIQKFLLFYLKTYLALRNPDRPESEPAEKLIRTTHQFCLKTITAYTKAVNLGQRYFAEILLMNDIVIPENIFIPERMRPQFDPMSQLEVLPENMEDQWILIRHRSTLTSPQTRLEKQSRDFGKWAFRNNSIEDAFQRAKKLIKYIKSGEIGSMKFCIYPPGTSIGPFAVVYCMNKDQKIKKIIEKVLKVETQWIYEWQTYNYYAAAILVHRTLAMVDMDPDVQEHLPVRLQRDEIKKRLRDPEIMKELGLSDFQVKLFLATFRKKEDLARDKSLANAEFAQNLKRYLGGREEEFLSYLIGAPVEFRQAVDFANEQARER